MPPRDHLPTPPVPPLDGEAEPKPDQEPGPPTKPGPGISAPPCHAMIATAPKAKSPAGRRRGGEG